MLSNELLPLKQNHIFIRMMIQRLSYGECVNIIIFNFLSGSKIHFYFFLMEILFSAAVTGHPLHLCSLGNR